MNAAIEYINAARTSDGRYVYRASETQSWWIFEEIDLHLLETMLDEGDDSDVYQLWCDASSAKELVTCGDLRFAHYEIDRDAYDAEGNERDELNEQLSTLWDAMQGDPDALLAAAEIVEARKA